MSDWNTAVVNEFRANGGKVGGNFEGAPMVVLHTLGAKTGQERVAPMMYLADGDRYLVFASKAGAPTHPDSYHNLKANPEVTAEVGAKTIRANAVELTGEEHDRFYAEQAKRYPGFAEYQRNTDRIIPVVALEPIAD